MIRPGYHQLHKNQFATQARLTKQPNKEDKIRIAKGKLMNILNETSILDKPIATTEQIPMTDSLEGVKDVLAMSRPDSGDIRSSQVIKPLMTQRELDMKQAYSTQAKRDQ